MIFDDNFKFREHISQNCRTCYYHTGELQCIRQYLPLSVANPNVAALTTVTELVTRRLVYHNLTFHNIKHIIKFQRGHTCLARVVSRSSRFSCSLEVFGLASCPISYTVKICIVT